MSHIETSAVWREGDRIRRADGLGYSDDVPDEVLEKHASIRRRSSMDSGADPAFARAVLAFRRSEREGVA